MQLTVGSSKGKRQTQAVVMALVVIGAVFQLATWIIAGSDRTLIMFGLGLVVCALVVHILNDWRSGVLIFLIWILFEDLARKYLGNSMVVYFAKDFLVVIAYLSFYFAKRWHEVETFDVPFKIPLLLFILFAFVQVFNVNSPSIFYGLLGMKLYFFYVPLMYLGYSMLRNSKDLDNLLIAIVVTGIVISGLGIAQSILGVQFLTPDDIAPELYGLTHVSRVSPITHQISVATSSVFVSAGRFSYYLVMLWVLAMGAQGYMLLSRKRGAVYGFIGIGVVSAAVMVSGTRTPFVFMVSSALMLTAGFLWGAPWKWGQGHRLVKSLRRAAFIGALGVLLLGYLFPEAIGGRWAFLSETLGDQGQSQGSDLKNRGWDYPIQNLLSAYNQEHWVVGIGTGTNSLGAQYIAQFFNAPAVELAGENGFGSVMLEMGIAGPILWLFWVTIALWSTWKIVKQLRQSVYFPIGFAIWWYAVISLVLLFFLELSSYQNFVNNAYLFLLLGVLFRLPKLAQLPQAVPMTERETALARWQLALGRR